MASSIADIVISILMKYQEYFQLSKSSLIDIKHIVNCSTIGKKT